MPAKSKLTLSIDKEILEKAKKLSEEKHLPLSGLIENFLNFFINPRFYCFECGKQINRDEANLCAKCGWLICNNCKVCRCGLDENTAIAIFHMRRTYEDLLSGRVK